MENIPEGRYCKWCHHCVYYENQLKHFCWKHKEWLKSESCGSFGYEAIKCKYCLNGNTFADELKNLSFVKIKQYKGE